MSIFIVLLLLLFAAPASATIYYVDATGGSDSNNGTAEVTAWQTLDKVNNILNGVGGTVVCGDSILFKKGETFAGNDTTDNIEILNRVCTESTKFTIGSYGSGSRPLLQGDAARRTDAAQSGAGIFISGSRWIVIQGIHTSSWNTNLFKGDDMLIDNNEFDTTSKEAFKIQRTDTTNSSERITVSNNIVHDAGVDANGECMYIGTDSAQVGGDEDNSNNITISGNEIYNCDEGIELKSGVFNITIERNIIRNNACGTATTCGAILIQRSIELVHTNAVVRYNRIFSMTGTGGDGVRTRGESFIYGNHIYSNGGDGVQVQDLTPDGFARLVYNNTIYSNTGACVTGSGAGYAQRNNICRSNGSGNDVADPLFIDAASAVFALQAASPAINAGASCDLAFNGAACDKGAHETLALSSAEVGLVDATTVVLTFSNNLHPPLLPAAACTGFSVEEDTGGGFVAATVSACARNGTNQVRLTLSGSITTESTVRFSYSTGTGNVTDSSLIGGSKSQRLNAITNSAVQNNVAGAPATHVFDQKTFQFYSVRTSGGLLVKLPHAVAALNTNIKTVPGGGVILGIQIDGTVADPPPIGVLPYYQKSGAGGYAAVPGSFGADNIRIGTAQTGSDVPAAGEVVSTCLTGALTVVNGAQVNSANAVPTFDLTQDDCIVNRWAIEWDTDVVDGDYYEIRLYNQSTSALDTYTVTPRIDIIGDRAGGGT